MFRPLIGRALAKAQTTMVATVATTFTSYLTSPLLMASPLPSWYAPNGRDAPHLGILCSDGSVMMGENVLGIPDGGDEIARRGHTDAQPSRNKEDQGRWCGRTALSTTWW